MNRLFDVRKQDGRPWVWYFQFLNLIFFKPYLYLSKSILLPTMATGSSFPTAFIYWVMFSRYFRTVWKLSRFVILYTTMKASAQRKYRWGSLSSCKLIIPQRRLIVQIKFAIQVKKCTWLAPEIKKQVFDNRDFNYCFSLLQGGDLGANRNNTQGVH